MQHTSFVDSDEVISHVGLEQDLDLSNSGLRLERNIKLFSFLQGGCEPPYVCLLSVWGICYWRQAFLGLLLFTQGAIFSKPDGNDEACWLNGRSMMYPPAPRGICCGINPRLYVYYLKAKLLINSITQIHYKSTCGHESMQSKRKKKCDCNYLFN